MCWLAWNASDPQIIVESGRVAIDTTAFSSPGVGAKLANELDLCGPGRAPGFSMKTRPLHWTAAMGFLAVSAVVACTAETASDATSAIP